mmetsp:Transcript_20972/g.80852  ORF Transcript_20972/g.80852 Transcript_20972/m.80852 type:complete len:363 (+) Transcript_20972:1485-2573(+)
MVAGKAQGLVHVDMAVQRGLHAGREEPPRHGLLQQRRQAGAGRARCAERRRVEGQARMVADEQALCALPCQVGDLVELCTPACPRGRGGGWCAAADFRRVEDDELAARRQRHHKGRREVAVIQARRLGAAAASWAGGGVEVAHPALPGTAAGLVVAAHEDPGRRGQQRACGLEKIGLPGVVAIAPGAGLANGHARRAGAFAVVVVADMYDQVGLQGERLCEHALKGPVDRVVAALVGQVGCLQPATGVADDNDAPRLIDRCLQRDAIHLQACDAAGPGGFAGAQREVRGLAQRLPVARRRGFVTGRAALSHGGAGAGPDHAWAVRRRGDCAHRPGWPGDGLYPGLLHAHCGRRWGRRCRHGR